MVGSAGALHCQHSPVTTSVTTSVQTLIRVNNERRKSSPSSSHLATKLQQKCHQSISKIIKNILQPCRLASPAPISHLQISCTDLKCQYGPGFPLSQRRKFLCWRRKRNAFDGAKSLQVKSLPLVTTAEVSLAAGLEVIHDLGLDTLTFLGVTVLVVPAFKAIKASPILGFFLSGVVLNHLGLIHNVTDVKALSELGILFLLFEMGLELSLARLRALAKFAFGMGLAQVLFSTLAFTAFELPPNGAIGTRLLEFLFHSRPDLVNIRTVDEAVVIGAALSMSSSAFVLQLLAEKGELPTRFGSATLGILLFQDIAVVPLLVILPILESGTLGKESQWPLLAAESLKALGGLGALSLGGRVFLRRIFEVVADSRSSEAFNALCLLTVTGTSLLTQKLGFSDTLGAFLAGALLAETNFRTQIEAEIRPFKGLLLGLFFVTTGTSIDLQLLFREWPNVLALLGGLIAIKTAIITAIGPRVGLSLPESVRIGLLLSQGGEFAFVVFSLANRLGVLPLELNRLLIIVVVLSMSLTPFLNEFGQKVAETIEARFDIPQENFMITENFDVSEPVVIIGFGQMGQVLANFLSTPLASGLGGDTAGWRFVAFDLDPSRVKAARKSGFPVLYGDGSRPEVLQTAGINMPKAVMVMYTARQKSVQAVERLRLSFPGIPIYARAQDLGHLLELKTAGATDAVLENTETSLQLGSVLLRGLGAMSDDVSFLTRTMRESMELRARVALEKQEEKEDDWLAPFQVKVRQTWNARMQSKVPENGSQESSFRVLEKEKQQVNSNSDVAVSEVQAGVGGDPCEMLLSSNGSLQGCTSERENPLSSNGLVAQVGQSLESPSESEGVGPEHPLKGQMPEVQTLTLGGPATLPITSIVPKGESRIPSSLAKAKLVWHRRIKISKHHGSSELEPQTDDHDEDDRGVTWCALTNDDGFHEFEEGEFNPDRKDQSVECMSNLDKP